MGNVLCKEPNTSASQSTGNTFSNLSSVICPNGLGKGKTHPMRKTYFTRSAVDASKKTTSATGWQSVGLHVPSAGPNPVIDTPPVAPPRKKRGATLDGRYRSDDSLQVKNGFQDVFGRESRRHSCDITPGTRPASVPPPRPEVAALPARQTSCFEIDASNDAFSDFSKVPTTAELERASPSASQIPRVGNRKSDKFFGERLADSLSATEANEANGETKQRRTETTPTADDVDKIEKFIETPGTEQGKAPVVVERRKHIGENRKSAVGPSEPLKEGEPPELPKDEPAKDGEEDLMKYIDRTVSGDNQIGRRAEFLMAMLEDYNDSVRYEGVQPVEEPLIVPKRRKSRHICDDHDHLHAKLHEHEREASGADGATLQPPSINVIRTEASIELAPRKPSRDFSKYKPIDPVDQEMFDSEDEPVARPARIKQTQRGQLPSPPAPPKFPKSRSESQLKQPLTTDVTPSTPLKPTDGGDETPPKAHTPRMLKRIISMSSTEQLGKEPVGTPPRPAFTKSASSGSFTGVDLQRARISVERFTPEDYAHHTGVDELVKPKSKLTTRKISWKSNEPPTIRTPTPTQECPGNPSFTIGGSVVVTTTDGNRLQPPEVPRRKRSDTSTESQTTGERESEVEPPEEDRTTKVSQAKLYQQLHSTPEDNSLRKFCLGSFIESSKVLQHHDVVNVLDRVYTASDNQENIIEQFQAFLEDQLNARLDEPNPANPNVTKLLEKLSHADSTSPVPSSKVGEDETLENIRIDLVGSSLGSGSSSLSQGKASDVDDCFDPEFEKIEKSEIVGELPKIEAHNPKLAGYSDRRRDSIEYMTDWFGGGDSDGSTTMLSGAGEDKGSEGKVQPLEGLGVGRKGDHHPPGAARRESIEDVGRWFSNHNILRPSFGEEFEEPSRRLRRGSDGFLGYDLHRQYPFGQGRERSESQSAEMFEDITKLQEHIKDTVEGSSPAGRIMLAGGKRKMLEHRNSSDALLMKVLHKPLLDSLNSSKQGSAEKLNAKPEHETVPKSTTEATTATTTTTTSSNEESKPLLNPDAPAATTGQDGKLTAHPGETLAASSVALLNDAKGEQHQQQEPPNEHSTLLKFLSKENLVE
uniref:Microtubule-associated protein futsch n=1 Tax=Anopheles atroparvus TaxID=41427 RepID=A0AAG5DCR6_ANOAO